jgi:hypothetical protein
VRYRVPFSDFLNGRGSQHARDLHALKSIEVEAASQDEAVGIVARVLRELHEILDGVEASEARATPRDS